MTTTTLCPICSAANPPTAMTCGTCGAPLAGDVVAGAPGALIIGTTLKQGVYSIGRVLGQGGFGITYLGGDTRLRRAVAIKEFFPFGSARRGREVHPSAGLTVADYQVARTKFLEEARVLTRFDHPSIVGVYDSFEENNTAYMVMELLRGRSLMELLEERGPLPEREAVRYVSCVAEALEIVHSANLLHRDLKPDNIMLTDDNRVVLIDFGTARTFAAGKTGRMTTMLTPGYAPLEQYGQNVRFGPYTDVYALAATAYHLLTGQMPAAAIDRATGVALKPPRQLNPSVSQTVSDAVMWGLEMRVDRRPQTISDFAAALQPTRAEPPPEPTGPPPAPWSAPPPPRPAPAPAPPPDVGPYDVEVRGQTLYWPQQCACCLEPPESALLVEHTGPGGLFGFFEDTHGWEVPYCLLCLEHVRIEASPPPSGWGGLLASAAASILLGGPIGLLVGLASAAGSMARAAERTSQLEQALKPSCVATGPAVEYRGWQDDSHFFSFMNGRYADAFARENGTPRQG